MGADQEGFDEVVEVETRLAAARKYDLDKLVAGHAGHPYCGCAEAGARQRLGSETAKETFWKVHKPKRLHGIYPPLDLELKRYRSP